MSGYPRPEELFGAATVPGILARAGRGERGITLIDGGLRETPLPYALLAATANRVATGLARAGVRPGDRVALVSTTSPRFLLSLFGVWRAGAVPAIIAPPHRLTDLAAIMADLRRRIAHIDARCLVAADSFGEFISKRIGPEVPVLTCGALVTGRADDPPRHQPAPEDIAYLQFTSGTTGPSKAVVLTHRQLLTNVAVCCQRLLVEGENSVHVSWAPLYHDLGLVAVLSAVAARIHLILQAPEAFLAAPDSFVDALSRFRATSTVAPNFAYGLAGDGMRLRPRRLDLSALRVCGDGSEPTRPGPVEAFTTYGAPYGLRPSAITPMYGLAEATLSVTMGDRFAPLSWDVVSRQSLCSGGTADPAPPGEPDARTLAVCGDAVPGVTVTIQDARGANLPDRVIGEICVRGPSVMLGYWQEPEPTAEVIRDGWLRTGDLGYRTPAGIVVCGRGKDMIIIGGANLYPEDYEHVAAQADAAVTRCAAFAVPGEERMIVAVELAGDGDPNAVADAVMARLRGELGHAPDRVVVIGRNAIPRTSSGKVQRGRCRESYFTGRLPVLAETAR